MKSWTSWLTLGFVIVGVLITGLRIFFAQQMIDNPEAFWYIVVSEEELESFVELAPAFDKLPKGTNQVRPCILSTTRDKVERINSNRMFLKKLMKSELGNAMYFVSVYVSIEAAMNLLMNAVYGKLSFDDYVMRLYPLVLQMDAEYKRLDQLPNPTSKEKYDKTEISRSMVQWGTMVSNTMLLLNHRDTIDTLLAGVPSFQEFTNMAPLTISNLLSRGSCI